VGPGDMEHFQIRKEGRTRQREGVGWYVDSFMVSSG
jgi:hypothetical protein